MTLKDLKVGESATIKTVYGEGALRQHFLDMGVIPGATATVVKFAPMGDPVEFRIHGYELTLRLSDAEQIIVEMQDSPVIEKEPVKAPSLKEKIKNRVTTTPSDDHDEHPGLGEGGRFHDKKHDNPVPAGTTLTFALAGNQNSGKTTLFNRLTGANQHVGNFPGVTVDRKTGVIRNHNDTLVTDLPGIYSMSPYSSEEVVSRKFILDEKPNCIINIVDATNIERNLYLTLQLLELDIPMVVALNMMDEMQGNGGSVRINKLEEALGVPVVPISAAKNEGINELIEHAIHIAKYREPPVTIDYCSPDVNGGVVHQSIHAVMSLIEDHCERAGISKRFAATKLLEGDKLVLDALNLDQNEKDTLGHIISQMEKERGLDHAAAIAEMRYNFIERVVSSTVVKPHESKERIRSQNIDKVLTGKWTALPVFIGIIALIFYLTFNVIGAFLQDLLAAGITALGNLVDAGMQAVHVNEVIRSLVIDGIFNGVGSVLSFLPIIVVLFFFLSLLEDTGYMARIAFFMDKLLRKIGLSGRSVVPLLIGFGCSVPAVMSSRTLPSERDRKMTIMLTPFMSCSAKLTIYAYFTAAFFPHHGGIVMVSLYLIGILTGIAVALISKKTTFKGEAVPFVMELPNYRMPGAKSVLQLLWQKSKDFITKAFTVIFVATIVIWFLQTFDITFNMVKNPEDSMLAAVAGFISPLFKSLGFSDWRISSALISGFLAKESVASTLGMLFGGPKALMEALTAPAAFVLLVFCLLYTPCVAAIASVKRELGMKWAVFTVLFQCSVAWLIAFLVRLVEIVFI